jgi:hypothetical protein
MDNAALQIKILNLTMSQSTRIWMNRIGLMLGLAGAVFVGLKIYAYGDQTPFRSITAFGFASMAGLAIVYGASNALLAMAWKNLLLALKSPVKTWWAIWAYGMSQIAKYIPGNICQFLGRQTIGLAAGLPGWVLVKSTAAELVLGAVCGATFAILVLPLSKFPVATSISVLVFSAAIIVLIVLARMFWNTYIAIAVLCYLVFLAVSGLIFSGALAIVHGGVNAWLPTIVGSYVVAWLAGFLTPGAPAGIGVREAVLLFLFEQTADGPAILLAIIIARMITMAGDFLNFGCCYAYGSLVDRSWTAHTSDKLIATEKSLSHKTSKDEQTVMCSQAQELRP